MGRGNGRRRPIIDGRRREEQEEVFGIPGAIKHQRGHEQEVTLRLGGQKLVQEQGGEEKIEERVRVEKQNDPSQVLPKPKSRPSLKRRFE